MLPGQSTRTRAPLVIVVAEVGGATSPRNPIPKLRNPVLTQYYTQECLPHLPFHPSNLNGGVTLFQG